MSRWQYSENSLLLVFSRKSFLVSPVIYLKILPWLFLARWYQHWLRRRLSISVYLWKMLIIGCFHHGRKRKFLGGICIQDLPFSSWLSSSISSLNIGSSKKSKRIPCSVILSHPVKPSFKWLLEVSDSGFHSQETRNAKSTEGSNFIGTGTRSGLL